MECSYCGDNHDTDKCYSNPYLKVEQLENKLKDAEEVIQFYEWNSPLSRDDFMFTGGMKICSAKKAKDYLIKYKD